MRVSVYDPLTDIAVLPRPSLVTLTLPLLTHSVLAAERVAGLLVTHSPRPALLTATHTAEADSITATVHFTHLCLREKDKHEFNEFASLWEINNVLHLILNVF